MVIAVKQNPPVSVTRKADGVLALDYNVQLAATGKWFNVQKTTDANGVTWYAIKPVVPFEQTKLYTDVLLYANGDTL